MNEMQLFRFETNSVRVFMDKNNEAWWGVKDVCAILGLSNVSETLKRVDEADISETEDRSTGQPRRIKTVSESGLYAIIFQSYKPEAKRFKRWVTSEVLPSIRKTGSYASPVVMPSHAEALRGWADEIDKNRALETKIATDAPKVAFAEALSASTECILVRDFVKILHQNGVYTGEKRFYEYLRESGYLMQTGESRNKPTQRAMDLGLFEVSTNLIACSGGEQLLKHTSKITPKGQKYFIEKLGAATPAAV